MDILLHDPPTEIINTQYTTTTTTTTTSSHHGISDHGTSALDTLLLNEFKDLDISLFLNEEDHTRTWVSGVREGATKSTSTGSTANKPEEYTQEDFQDLLRDYERGLEVGDLKEFAVKEDNIEKINLNRFLPPPPPVHQNPFNSVRLTGKFIPKTMVNKFNNGKLNFLIHPVECSICLEEVTSTYSFPYCQHSYCVTCVKQHLTQQIFQHRGEKLSCPNPKCKSQITLSDLELLVDSSVFDKFILYMMIKEKQFSDTKVVFCLNCDQPLDVRNATTVKCDNPTCEAEMCITCYSFTHPLIDCEKNRKNMIDAMSPEEKATIEMFKKEQVKQCPQCSSFVFKVDGCEHVTCTACSHQFCYYCLEPHNHILSTHVHGPLYQAPVNDSFYVQPIRRRRRGAHRHKAKALKVLKYFGYGVAIGIIVPPAIALTAVSLLFVWPVYHIYSCKKKKQLKKTRAFHVWCINEKKRREDLNLPVSDYISRNAIIPKKKIF